MGILDKLFGKKQEKVRASKKADVVEGAIARVSDASDEKRIEIAMELLKHPNYEIRAAVASITAKLGIEAVGVWFELANKLGDDYEKVRLEAAKAFWQLKGVDYAIRSLRDEFDAPAHMGKEEALRGIDALREISLDKSTFAKLLEENWEDCPRIKKKPTEQPIEKIREATDEPNLDRLEEKKDDNITCASCKNKFTWNEAYYQQETPDSTPYHPLGHGNTRPRVFCPHCGALVVDWHITREKDFDEWIWFGGNATLNAECSLPPSPYLYGWGKNIPIDFRPFYAEYKIDVKKIEQFNAEYEARRRGVIKEVTQSKEEEISQKLLASYPYTNSLTVSPKNEDVAWISCWEAERFSSVVLSPTKLSPRLEMEHAVHQKPTGYTAIMRHILFITDNRLLIAWPLDTSSARLLLVNAENGKELTSKDVPCFEFYYLCANNKGDTIAAQIDGESLLVVSIDHDKLIHRTIQTGSIYGPEPYFAPNGRLYALHYQTFFGIENDHTVRVTSTNEANSIAFDLVGNAYFGGGFSDRSGPSSLQVVKLDSGESRSISWGLEPIDVIEPLGDDKLLLGNMVNSTNATLYPDSHVSLFSVSQSKKEWTINLTDIAPFHSPISLTVPEEGWALLQSGRLLKQVSLDNGEVLAEFPKEKDEFVQARWLRSHRILCISRNRSKDDPGTLELYKIG